MDNPHISRSRGLSKRRQVANMDRVNPQSNNLLDNRAMGIARLIATHKLNGDFQKHYPLTLANNLKQYLFLIMLIRLLTATFRTIT